MLTCLSRGQKYTTHGPIYKYMYTKRGGNRALPPSCAVPSFELSCALCSRASMIGKMDGQACATLKLETEKRIQKHSSPNVRTPEEDFAPKGSGLSIAHIVRCETSRRDLLKLERVLKCCCILLGVVSFRLGVFPLCH